MAEFGDAEPLDDDHFRLMEEAYRTVFARHLPSLKFVDGDEFTVEGIEVDEDPSRLSEALKRLVGEL